jgi:uncharacterized membrane protein YfcA
MENFFYHLEQFKVITALVVFLVYILVDGLYAYYTLAVSQKKAINSATSGALMHFLLAFGVMNYVQNYLYVIPLAMGSWLGTYIVVKKSNLVSAPMNKLSVVDNFENN